MTMERTVSRHRQHSARHDGSGNADEYSTIISSESTDPCNNRFDNSSSRSCATNSAIRRKAIVLGHCVINSLIVVLIVAVSITFLGSICIGLILLIKPLPSSLQDSAYVTIPSYAVFHDDQNSFSLQYASNRNGSIYTDDDVFIMDRNFPTPKPIRLPTSASPTKVLVRTSSTLTKAPTPSAVTSAYITNQKTSMQNRDGQNYKTVNASNLIIDSSLKQNTSSKVGFTFNDDGKSINNDDPFGSNISEGSVDDIVAAAETSTTSNEVTTVDSNSLCTGSNCNKSFMDDVLQNALATQNIDDTVSGSDNNMASFLMADFHGIPYQLLPQLMRLSLFLYNIYIILT